MALGTILIQRGLLTSAQLDTAVAAQRASGERLDRVLARLGLVPRAALLDAVGDHFHMPVVDLAGMDVPAAVLSLLPAKLVYKQRCVPIRLERGRDGNTLTVATADPYEIDVLDELRLLTGFSIEPVLADEDELHKFVRTHYGVAGDTLDAMTAGDGGEGTGAGSIIEAKLDGQGDDVEQAQEASVIKLVNDLLAEAIAERATDVHIEPYERELLVRYRIDGVLHRANLPPTVHRFGAAIVSRLKIMASLNIAEKRLPQDGRITFRSRLSGNTANMGSSSGGMQEFDLRVSIIPMLFGEGVVLRVLSKTTALMSLADLGMPAEILGDWRQLIDRPHGILLVTGPTGSGKSTTLYASLNTIVSDKIKVITVEDPVEYHVAGVNQIQVNHKVGLTFAAGLRSILRHDPDVVMIGEIRDKETAETAIQASLTGHLVFSTLHTNDASGAATRLLDMGVEPFLVSSSVEGVLAQRLVRRLCASCGVIVNLDVPLAHDANEAIRRAHAGPLHEELASRGGGRQVPVAVGCRACRGTGYRGRVGVYELLRLTEDTRQLIMDRASAPKIAAQAIAQTKLRTLREDGFTKVRAGLTTVDEIASAVAE